MLVAESDYFEVQLISDMFLKKNAIRIQLVALVTVSGSLDCSLCGNWKSMAPRFSLH